MLAPYLACALARQTLRPSHFGMLHFRSDSVDMPTTPIELVFDSKPAAALPYVLSSNTYTGAGVDESDVWEEHKVNVTLSPPSTFRSLHVCRPER